MAELRYDIIGTNKLSTVVKSATTDLKSLEGAANSANGAIKKQQGFIQELNNSIKQLNKDKINTADEAKLARINKLLEQQEADLKRLNNIGKSGFDEFGESIKKSNSSLEGFGSGLTKGLGYLRTIAYILPGIGIAGIFNLAFSAISSAASSLEIFNKELTVSESNLANLNDVTKNAAKQYGEQSTNLKILYLATQDVANSDTNRLLAAKELQKEFPSLFGNIKTETILNGGAADAYNLATAAILQNAKAKAAASKISELAAKQLEIDFQKQKIINAKTQEIANVKPIKQIGGGAGDVIPQFASPEVQKKSIKDQQQTLKDLLRGELEQQDARKKALQNQIDFLVQFAGGNNNIASALSAGENTKTPKAGEINSSLADANKQLDEIYRKTQDAFEQSGLTGYALEIQKINDKYAEQDNRIQTILNSQEELFKKGKIPETAVKTSRDKAQSDFDITDQAKQKEISDAKIAEAERVANEIERINNHAGIKTEESQEKELAQIKAFYDKEENLAKKNEEILSALRAGRAKEIADVNQKYIDKSVADFNKLFTDANDKIAKKSNKSEDDLSNVISRSLRNFGQGFIDTLTNVETYSKGTFASIFADLTSQLSSSLNRIFQDIVLNGLAKALSAAISTGTSSLVGSNGKITGLGAAVAGAGLAGGVLSAATPKTSTLGQAAGGALSGAGAGFLIGGPVGAVVGGVVGAISGIFGASSARKKQEELQKQQLDEAKKQTALLESQQRAYESQIIGRLTANGTITGINVGSQGQLIATVSGKDLQFVLDRTKNVR